MLIVAVLAVGLPWAELPVPVRVSVGALAGYAVLSYASILWAANQGVAWEGANRTLIYLLVFALFACWRRQGSSAAVLLCVWTLGLAGLALFVAVHLEGASAATVARLLPEGRLTYPSGYANANAAQWLMAFWPALLLARSEHLAWWLRGLFAGSAVVLAETALLSQSRGSLYATPVMLVLVFALLPGRRRTFALLVPVGAGIAACAPAVLHVGNDLSGGRVVTATLHTALETTIAAGCLVGIIVAGCAFAEGRLALSDGSRARIGSAVTALSVVVLLAVLAGGLAAAGNPVTRVRHAWDTFTSERGYAANGSGSRLTSGLGSSRYDFYRVALDEFTAHPLVGIGADNFAQAYLAHGRGDETPHYPHSVELRTLAETGLLGALLAIVGLAAALLACLRAVRAGSAPDRDPLARAVAAAALGGFGYWVVHGSFDWFWEFAGLGAPAFALLGLCCSLSSTSAEQSALAAASTEGPDGGDGARPVRRRRRRRSRRRQKMIQRVAILAAGTLLTAVAAISLALPWFSQLEIQSAAKIWTTSPARAYSQLGDAARLDPLSDEAELVSGTIALRYEDLTRADHEFTLALGRNPDDVYATLVEGVIASAAGDRTRSLALLARAARLDPHEQIAQEALTVVREGRRISLAAFNRAILGRAQQFI
jgi:tetratricopeptide (TPR) repeat protein